MTLEEILRMAVQKNASDIHLKVGVAPVIRVHGVLRPLTSKKSPLTAEELNDMARQVVGAEKWAQFEERHEIDIGYGIAGVARFRVNIFYQRGTIRMVIRNVPHQIPTFEELNLPEQVTRLALLQRGLVLITGVAGSGKSTTLAALINEINQTSNRHILTIEDPIEFLIRDHKSLITQREIGVDARSFAEALRAGLRQDPDIILIGEMRDRETMEIALTAAETGHLVFSTLHTMDAPESINRILSNFEAERQSQIRLMLGSVLRTIVSQRLCSRKDGSGYVPAVEILINTGRVREQIESPDRGIDLHAAIEEGRAAWGMQSFDQSLMELLAHDVITLDEALLHSSHPEDFRIRVSGVTSMDGKKFAKTEIHAQTAKEWAADADLELTSVFKLKKA